MSDGEEQPRPVLWITRGLPGSGKSTWARQWVSEDPAHRAEVNRDWLRLMMHGGYADAERQVTAARDAAISALLRQGVSVACSDTNLPQRVARDLAAIARRAEAGFEVHDLTCVPLSACLGYNAARTDKPPVPEEWIKDMHARYIAGRPWPLPLPEEPQPGDAEAILYVPRPGAPKCVIVDIDGTTALKGARSPFDETRVHEDRPNLPVIEMVRLLDRQGHRVIFMSGRTAACMKATSEWLDEHVGVPYFLYMRPKGDTRKDSIVKRELFDKHVRDDYTVTWVLDDRDQVVRMWREELGLTCLQVAEGNF